MEPSTPDATRGRSWRRLRFAPRVRTLMALVLVAAGVMFGWAESRRRAAVRDLTDLLPLGVAIAYDGNVIVAPNNLPNALYRRVDRVKALHATPTGVAAVAEALEAARPGPDRLRTDPASGRDFQISLAAIAALLRFGPEAKAAAPALARTLRKTESSRIKAFAAFALGQLGRDDPAAVAALVEALDHRERDNTPDGRVASGAAQALGAMGPNARAAIPKLVERVTHPVQVVRASAVMALVAIGPDPAHDAIPALLAALDDEDATVRALAASALRSHARSPETARTAVAALEARLDREPDAYARGLIAQALSQLRASSDVPKANVIRPP